MGLRRNNVFSDNGPLSQENFCNHTSLESQKCKKRTEIVKYSVKCEIFRRRMFCARSCEAGTGDLRRDFRDLSKKEMKVVEGKQACWSYSCRRGKLIFLVKIWVWSKPIFLGLQHKSNIARLLLQKFPLIEAQNL